MTYLYSPPTWRHEEILEGSLRFGITTSTCVYRQSGVWHNVQMPGMDVFDNPLDTEFGIELFFTRPTQVPDTLVAELTANALTPADPSWTAGTLTPL